MTFRYIPVTRSHAVDCDFYPLTSYSQDNDIWMAWQFDRAELGGGVVQAFRRDNCIYETARLKLKGLHNQADYMVRNLDQQESQKISGQELMEKGLLVSIPDVPAAVVIVYKKIDGSPLQ